MRQSKHNQSHFRFTDEEYEQLLDDSEVYNKTIPDLMKAVYFRRKLPRPVMNRDEANRMIRELNRIGNNINQMARKINSGFREGFNPEIEKIGASIDEIKNFIMGHHGHRQDQVC